MKDTPILAIIHDPRNGVWMQYSHPVEVVIALRLEDVKPALQHIEDRVETDRLKAVGFISYEASSAFDSVLTTSPPDDFPLLWFGLFHDPESTSPPKTINEMKTSDLVWTTEISQEEHAAVLSKIKEEIAEGNTYQVNFTFRLRSGSHGDPQKLFARMLASQSSGYGAFIDTGRFVICSASPELFFSLDGNHILSRPMKGTAQRGLWYEDDHNQAQTLIRSKKERAENMMITDMVRNDLGRIAEIGSVNTPKLFTVERYPTVWQMTSTIEAITRASVAEIFSACFPPASITGAPKSSTMQLISKFESSPRNIYTGAIGTINPGRNAQFSVAIRTALVDRERQTAEYGIGGGIVWDSQPEAEWIECQTKARILNQPIEDFELIETLSWEPDQGYSLLNRHIKRLIQSAEYFEYPISEKDLRRQLFNFAESLPDSTHKVRLLLNHTGNINLSAELLQNAVKNRVVRVGLARRAVDSKDSFLYHKTTHRHVYESAIASQEGCDDVILTNEKDEVTESCIANVVVRIDGVCYTPPLHCGLLPGTQRAELLARNEINERILIIDDLEQCDSIYLINSVRGWMKASLIK